MDGFVFASNKISMPESCRGGLKSRQLRAVEKRMAAERAAAVTDCINNRAPKKAAGYREKVTPRLLGNAEMGYQDG